MSTKNLARTLIEGGRNSFNKYRRWQSHADERVRVRSYLARAGRNEDGFDARVVEPRRKVGKSFNDRLSAPRRWLRSHVGRPWDKVRSEMFERFDPRTLAGRHIIFGHLLQAVRRYDEPVPRFASNRFVIDRYGILRVVERVRHGKPCHANGVALRALHAWAGDRRIGGAGDALYWFVPVRECARCTRERCCCPLTGGKHRHEAHQHYRQHARLGERDLAFWQRLCLHDRARFGVPVY